MVYMAPQLILQERPQYSIRCDVWSVGVVMYYVMCKKYRSCTVMCLGISPKPSNSFSYPSGSQWSFQAWSPSHPR